MKFLKIFGIIVVSLIALFFIIGLFLPKTYSVNRSAVINAPDSVLFTNVSDFNQFLTWAPWAKMDPDAKIDVTGAPSQPGHFYSWAGEETGKGNMKIAQVAPFSSVDFILTFTEPFNSVANTAFTFEPVTGGTKVTWTMSGESGSTVEKWMYLNMDGMLGKDFESGLINLAELSEK